MAKIKEKSIKWGWNKHVSQSPRLALIEAIPLFCAELMRTDEIGLVTSTGRQIVLVQHEEKRPPNGSFKILASQEFAGFGWPNLFERLNLKDGQWPECEIVSGFELLLYRPEPGELYTPLKYTSYEEAVKACDRQLFVIFTVMTSPQFGSLVSMAHVSRKVSLSLFNGKINAQKSGLADAVGDWIKNSYTEEMGEQVYADLSQYPLAERAADSLPIDPNAPQIQLQENTEWGAE